MLKTVNQMVDTIEKIEIKINDGNLSNKLSMNDLKQLIVSHGQNSESSSSHLTFLKKLKLIKIKNFIYNLNNRDDCIGDFMKLDEVNVLNNESFFLRNLDFYKQNRLNYSLLDKIEILLVNHNELYFFLNDSNFYMELDLIDKLLVLYNEIGFTTSSLENGKFSKNSNFFNKFKLVNVKLTDFFLNLINDKMVYTLGSSLLDLEVKQNERFTSNVTEILFNSEYFVVFKSNLEKNK